MSDPHLRIYEVHWLKLAFQVIVFSCVEKSTSKITAYESLKNGLFAPKQKKLNMLRMDFLKYFKLKTQPKPVLPFLLSTLSSP